MKDLCQGPLIDLGSYGLSKPEEKMWMLISRKVRCQTKKKRYYLGIFPKRWTPPPTPPFWEPLIQKNMKYAI